MLQKFNHYGNDTEVYEACAEPIRQSNFQHSVIISWWFLLVNVLYLVCAEFEWLNVDAGSKWLYAAYIAATAAFLAVSAFVPKFRQLSHAPTIINIAILASFGIAVSNAAPYAIGFMFLVIMLVIATSYIVTMFRMGCIQVVCAVLFILFSYMNKPLSISFQDISNTVIIMGISLMLHYPFQSMRIRQFVINNQNMQIRRELEIESSFDSMTPLFARSTFFALCGEALLARSGFTALCVIDLDEFKQINDRLGHQEGDRAIRVTGNTIADVLGMDVSDKWDYKETVIQGGGSFAGRLGGDEFIMLIRDRSGEDEVLNLLEDLLVRLNQLEEGEIHGLHASIGMTQIADVETDVDDAYKRADDALYQSKRNGKNQVSVG